MTLRVTHRHNYTVGIADGYMQPERSYWVRTRADTAPSMEQAAAEYLHLCITGRAIEPPPAVDSRHPVSDVHVWVVGSAGWLTSPPNPLKDPAMWRDLAGDDESDPQYRIVLWGVGGPSVPSWDAAHWGRTLARASFLDKRRADARSFDTLSALVLDSLAARYGSTRLPPTEAILGQHCRVAYAGAL